MKIDYGFQFTFCSAENISRKNCLDTDITGLDKDTWLSQIYPFMTTPAGWTGQRSNNNKITWTCLDAKYTEFLEDAYNKPWCTQQLNLKTSKQLSL